MTYSFVVDVPAPIEMYDATHAAVAAAAGFQVVEVWESKEHCERFNQTVVGPAIAALTGGQPMPQPPIASFDVRGLVIPSGKILI
jgi:hypothetical protein